ncbi:hypothetical protein ABEB36_015638 [Hypothenemus hampei]|uniref:C2H2-type domain-containing protein n=1 Tax=Hypothenemus hampei TaxID=57062 RepID=A0ABD1E3N6_HYPHA
MANRAQRLVAMAQEFDVPSPDIGYQSEQSSPAPSINESLLNILSPEIFEDSDNSINDPSVVFQPNVYDFEESSDNDSEIFSSYSLKSKKEIQLLDDINAESKMKLKNYKNEFIENWNSKIFNVNNVNDGASTSNYIASETFNGTGPHLETENTGEILIKNDINLAPKTTFFNIRKKKRTHCKFCLTDVTNFERHLERNHADCKEVIDMLSYPRKHGERKKIISIIRNAGNFNEFLKGNIFPKYGTELKDQEYYPCHRCKALLSKKYLSRHKKKCIVQNMSGQNKMNELAQSQTMIACSLDENNTINKLRVKEEVFSRMKVDKISLIAKTDYLICMFGENYLKKHKREQIISVCSNKMRELARLLLEIRKISNKPNFILQDILSPVLFDITIEAAKKLGGYDGQTKTYKCPSLSAHLGTSLKQVCELFMRLLLKEDPSVKVTNKEQVLKETKRYKELIETQWTTEISSLAFKNLSEKRWAKPVILPLTSDVKKFRDFVTQSADKAIINLKENLNNKKEFRTLVEASLILTVLFNRRRIGDVQYTALKTYTQNNITCNQEECENALTETEKLLTKQYKRLVTGGKGSRSIAILLPLKLQEYIDYFVSIRKSTDIVPNDNKYLFGCPGTTK